MVHVIAITGAGHSGSTILNRVLASYDSVVAVGEFRRIWGARTPRELCGCGEPFQSCPFWNAVMERYGGWSQRRAGYARWRQDVLYRWYAVPFLRLGLRPRFLREPLEEFAETRRALLEAIVHESGASIIVDSSKSASFALALAASGVDVTVVHLKRDARGVVHSAIRRALRWGPIEPRRQAGIARYYGLRWLSRTLRADLSWAGSSNRIGVRYEDFARNPEGAARWILARAGMTVPPAPGRRTFDLSGQHIFAGNPSRMGQGERTIEPDERWREEMPRVARRVTVALTWPLLWWYGYLRQR